MDSFKVLQHQIGQLSEDFDKDEETLASELRALDKQNFESLQAYQNVQKSAVSAKESLCKIVDKLN